MKNFLIIGLAITLLMACGQAEQSKAGDVKAQKFSWSLVTTWPKNYPGLGMAPERFSKLVEEMSQGQLKVTVYGAGEFVPCHGRF
jgi:TRAP-type mannitol/chloroaromatic compound transport system substrate-binding protein